MNSQTFIQRQIENQVTSGRGYDRRNTSRTPYELLDTEVGLQIALCNMDASNGNLDIYTVIGFSSKLEAMLKKFDDASIPIDVITDANGFKKAFDSAYASKSNSKVLINKETAYNPSVQPVYGLMLR
jgi:hypothetical protein